MPKTFTDDIAAAFPSSIDGPFLVVDPADSANSIKLDPASGQITAGGSARPERSIALSLVRTYSTTGNGAIGGLATRSIATGTNGGYYAGPFRIPQDMDVTEPSNIWFLTATGAVGPASVQTVRFLLVDTYIRGTGSSTSTTLDYDWSTPSSWGFDDNRIVLFDAGSGRTYDANRFAVGDFLGMRVSRNGTHPNDTYSKTIHLSESIIFEYTAKTF